jgi:hypothetical protein
MSPQYQSCPAGTYYADQGNSFKFNGVGQIFSVYNGTASSTTEGFQFDVTISTTETINNQSAFSVGYADVVNAGISNSTGVSISKSTSYSGLITVNVPTPPYSTAFAQGGFDSENSHGYVYDETTSCQTTDVYSVSSTVAPYSHGGGGWVN